MKTLVLYDSQYGNTEKIAQAIGKAVSSTKTLIVGDATLQDLKGVRLLIIGSPTQGGRPTVSLQTFLDSIPAGSLRNVHVAVFDTRFLEEDLNFALKLLVKTIGYAAPKIAKNLEDKGGTLILPPEGFIVKGKKGPLASGELDRAKNWIPGGALRP